MSIKGCRQYTQEERAVAITLYLKYDKNVVGTIRELGYPSRQMLYHWYADYLKEQETGEPHKTAKYSEEQKLAAVEHYLESGQNQVRTIRALGYTGRELLAEWVKEIAPEACKKRKCVVQYSEEQKRTAVVEACTLEKPVAEVARNHGV
jgi:transposase-like protein